MVLALAAEVHHDPAVSTDRLYLVVPVLVLLVGATVWAWRRGGGLTGAALVAALSGLWLLVDPVHEPSLYTFGRSHAVTPGDLVVLPALVFAGVSLRRRRRRS